MEPRCVALLSRRNPEVSTSRAGGSPGQPGGVLLQLPLSARSEGGKFAKSFHFYLRDWSEIDCKISHVFTSGVC